MSTVTYQRPTWSLIENLTQDDNTVVAGSSTPIGTQNSGQVAAYQFCQEFDYALVSYVIGESQPLVVSWDINNSYWEDSNNKSVFLQISCDNGLNESLGEVNIANMGDLMLFLGLLICLGVMQVTLLVFGRN